MDELTGLFEQTRRADALQADAWRRMLYHEREMMRARAELAGRAAECARLYELVIKEVKATNSRVKLAAVISRLTGRVGGKVQ